MKQLRSCVVGPFVHPWIPQAIPYIAKIEARCTPVWKWVLYTSATVSCQSEVAQKNWTAGIGGFSTQQPQDTESDERTMTRRPRRNHNPAFKAKVAVAKIKGRNARRLVMPWRAAYHGGVESPTILYRERDMMVWMPPPP